MFFCLLAHKKTSRRNLEAFRRIVSAFQKLSRKLFNIEITHENLRKQYNVNERNI